eukprot:2207762-Pleurochrysis_carterae.AAC.1
MDMGRARGRVHSFSSEQVGELLREELSRVVAVERSYHARRCVLATVEQGSEPGKEVTDVRWGF